MRGWWTEFEGRRNVTKIRSHSLWSHIWSWQWRPLLLHSSSSLYLEWHCPPIKYRGLIHRIPKGNYTEGEATQKLTLLKVAALPMVGAFSVKFSWWHSTGSLSRAAVSSVRGTPPGTWDNGIPQWGTVEGLPHSRSQVRALTCMEKSLTILKSLTPSSAKYSAWVKRSCVVFRGPSPRVKRYIAKAMEDMFLALRTISLWGSSHFSASASISEVISFISRPSLAILACSCWRWHRSKR